MDQRIAYTACLLWNLAFKVLLFFFQIAFDNVAILRNEEVQKLIKR